MTARDPARAADHTGMGQDSAASDLSILPRREQSSSQKGAPAHTDWLYHHLTVTGPDDALAAFGAAASGTGILPWHLDLDRLEEDWFLLVVAPRTGEARTLSLEGARLLAADLRDAVARRHALATARVGHSTACPFDLHALVPVPTDVLRLGPDHPDALHWLWTSWGTTEPLRAVCHRPVPTPKLTEGTSSGQAFAISFWSADWTPWRALETVRVAWPALRFDVRPIYDRL